LTAALLIVQIKVQRFENLTSSIFLNSFSKTIRKKEMFSQSQINKAFFESEIFKG